MPEPTLPHAGLYLSALDRLAAMLDGVPWFLAGGLAIPLTIGRFYREHDDIDVALNVASLPAASRAMRRAGYRLTTRVHTRIGFLRIALRVPQRSSGWLLRLRQRKLSFVGPAAPADPLLGRIDVVLHREEGAEIVACNSRRRAARTEPIEGRRVALPSGRDVCCLHLHYARSLMTRRAESKHALDRAMLDEALGYGSLVTASPPDSSLATSHIA